MSGASHAMNSMPSVTVVIPTFNRRRELCRALDSVFCQTLAPSQVIVVDDCSTDDTQAFVEREFPSVLYICLTTKGNASVARNAGISLATGSYIAFLDSDDSWRITHLESAVSELESRGGIGGVVCSIVVERPNRPALERVFDEHKILDVANKVVKGNLDTRSSSLVVRRHVAEHILFDPDFEKHQDWDFAIRCAETYRLAALPCATVVLDISGKNRMSARPNYLASGKFLARHAEKLSAEARAHFNLMIAQSAFSYEGRTKKFWQYWYASLSASNLKSAKSVVKLSIMVLPGARFVYQWLAP